MPRKMARLANRMSFRTTGTPGALRSPPVASEARGRMLSSTPFQSSSGEYRLRKPSVSGRRIWRRQRTTIAAAPHIPRAGFRIGPIFR
jgi:hypothetical protein